MDGPVSGDIPTLEWSGEYGGGGRGGRRTHDWKSRSCEEFVKKSGETAERIEAASYSCLDRLCGEVEKTSGGIWKTTTASSVL